MSRFLLGIDAGGTQLRAVVFDPREHRVVERWNLAAAPDGGPEPLRDLLVTYQASLHSVCAGITKISRGEVCRHWETVLAGWFPSAVVRVVPDFVIAFHGAVPDACGALVVAGTGSVVYAENGTGSAVRVGGRGWEYGDEGSGAHMTAELVRRAVRACDGLAEKTALTRQVCQELGTSEAGALAEAARRQCDAAGRGFLVPFVLERARAGDTEAISLFVGAAGWLARLVRTAHTRLGADTDKPFSVATVGGLWEAGDLLVQPFLHVLTRAIPKVKWEKASLSPCDGAIKLAAEAHDKID